MNLVFWISTVLVVYTYFAYPLLLTLFAAKHSNKKHLVQHSLPTVEVLISAFNEESCIANRIENLLASEYGGDIVISVASDGSQDRTAEILSAYKEHSQINVLIHTRNRGKVAVLNDLVKNSRGEYLVFTDANTIFETDTIKQLISSFDSSVGAVCGELHLYNPANNDNRDSLYWRYEQFLKKRESALGSLLGANGAVYAIKRNLYKALPDTTVVDDFCIAMNIKKQGYNVIYNQDASAREEVAPTLKDEYGRRVRIGLGNYRAFFSNIWALSPLKGVFAWCYWSHKVLRWFVPHLLLLILLSNVFLIQEHFVYTGILILQIGFYSIAIWGAKNSNKQNKNNALVSTIGFFVSMNVALGHGFIKFIRGSQQGSWNSTAR